MDQQKLCQFEIKVVNNIDDIAKFYGIKKDKIKQCIKNKKIYDSRYLDCKDTIALFKTLKLDYKLHPQLNVVDDIQQEWLLEDRKCSFITLGIMGHINHGKTTLIKKMMNITIKEDGDITQNISVHQHKELFLVDTPGHELFHRFREHVLKIIDVILLVVSLEDGFANETKRVVDLILERSLQDLVCVVFTKSDIAKYQVDNLIQLIEQRGLCLDRYIVIDYNQDVYKQIYGLIQKVNIKQCNFYNHLITIKSMQKNFNLVKLNFGRITKKTAILSQLSIYRVSGIFDLNFKAVTAMESPCFCYCTTDTNMNINDIDFLVTDDVIKVENYNKYILGIKYIESFNRVSNESAYMKKKIVCIIEDIIYYNIIQKMTEKYNLDRTSIIVFKSDKHIIQTIEKTQSVILFRLSDSKDVVDVLSAIGASMLEFSSIYQLEDYLSKNDLDIFNNVSIVNLAQVVKIFDIKNKRIIGCRMLKGSFKMNQKVSIAKDATLSDVNPDAIIVSMKQEDKFIKQTKKDVLFGIVFGSNLPIEENYYVYST